MIDLAQVSLALRNCTARSLVLLDEFGKGTLSTGSSTLPTSPLSAILVYSLRICRVFAGLLDTFKKSRTSLDCADST